MQNENVTVQNENVNAANAASENAVEATATNAVVEGTTKKFTLKVKRVQLFDNADIVNVTLTFDKAIPGFARDKDNNYVPAEVDTISFPRSGLTRTLCEKDDMLATMRDGQSEPLTRVQFSTVLHGAVLNVTRTYHAQGFVPEGRDALDRPQWFTDIDNVSLTDFAKNLIEKLVMQRLLQN